MEETQQRSLWISTAKDVHGDWDRPGTNHHSTLSGVMLNHKSCHEKCYGMNYGIIAYIEQPLLLPVGPRTKSEVIHTVKQHGLSSSLQCLEAGVY